MSKWCKKASWRTGMMINERAGGRRPLKTKKAKQMLGFLSDSYSYLHMKSIDY